MLYVDAETLVRAACDANILQWADDNHETVAIYHKAGDENHPEGWYADPLEEVAQSVMKNKHVQNILLSKLHQQGIYPKWFDVKGWKQLCEILGVECNLEEEMHEG